MTAWVLALSAAVLLAIRAATTSRRIGVPATAAERRESGRAVGELLASTAALMALGVLAPPTVF
ncbi:hypothetical protein ACHAAC_17150 [Aeromicrobium sp. CF4.19]|uniref:hypothetical protein n=1 Tax=Aeromicrobium sp. CF4.19 TaxID=3373082 RepID=UPI003EE45788